MDVQELPPAPQVVESKLVQHLRARLEEATGPLKLAEITKGFKKPAKQPKADFEAEVTRFLDDELLQGRVFRYPSGTKGIDRYWTSDEKHHLRERAIGFASEPRSMAALKKELASAYKSEAGFVESLIQSFIGEDTLHEHTVKNKPAFANYPPPPPPRWHEIAKYEKMLNGLVTNATKLLGAAGISPAELLEVLRERFGGDEAEPAGSEPFAVTESVHSITEQSKSVNSSNQSNEGLRTGILSRLSNTGEVSVLSIAELRRAMPPEDRGVMFDTVVLELAEAGTIRLYQDSSPAQFTPEQRQEFVTDQHGHLFTAIATLR